MNRDELYELDEHKWLTETAKAYENDKPLFTYLCEMSRREEREVKSYLVILFTHLLKYQYQYQKGTNSWYRSVRNSSMQLQEIFESDSLYNKYLVQKYYITAYDKAKKLAAGESGLSLDTFPKEFPWNPEKVWTEDFIDNFLIEYHGKNSIYNK